MKRTGLTLQISYLDNVDNISPKNEKKACNLNIDTSLWTKITSILCFWFDNGLFLVNVHVYQNQNITYKRPKGENYITEAPLFK